MAYLPTYLPPSQSGSACRHHLGHSASCPPATVGRGRYRSPLWSIAAPSSTLTLALHLVADVSTTVAQRQEFLTRVFPNFRLYRK